MDALRVRGTGKPLVGKVRISGAKNAALPILCATLLSDGASRLRNVPKLRDMETTSALLRFLGRDVDVIAENGEATEMVLRKLAERDGPLRGKRVIIWEVTMHELTSPTNWPVIRFE